MSEKDLLGLLFGYEDVVKLEKGITRLEKLQYCLNYMIEKSVNKIVCLKGEESLGILTKDSCIEFIERERV